MQSIFNRLESGDFVFIKQGTVDDLSKSDRLDKEVLHSLKQDVLVLLSW